jgi:AhpD family alkylhydroperoxidase
MARVALLDEAAGARLRGQMGPEARRALAHRPALGDAIGRYNAAVAASELPPRLHELVRYRIAQLNGCQRCMAHRSEGNAAAGVTEELLAEVAGWRTATAFSGAERAALDFAERFAADHRSIDDGVVEGVRAHLGDGGVVDLAACVAKYVAIGRLITVLDLDQACVLVGGAG